MMQCLVDKMNYGIIQGSMDNGICRCRAYKVFRMPTGIEHITCKSEIANTQRTYTQWHATVAGSSTACNVHTLAWCNTFWNTQCGNAAIYSQLAGLLSAAPNKWEVKRGRWMHSLSVYACPCLSEAVCVHILSVWACLVPIMLWQVAVLLPDANEDSK